MATKKMKKQSIKRFEQLPPELKKIQEENGETFMVGDMFFYRDDTIIRIREISFDAKWREKWVVYYQHAKDWEATDWSDYGQDDFDSFAKRVGDGTYVKISKPLNEALAEANKVISGEISIDAYSSSQYDESMNEERALIGKTSKEGLLNIQRELELKKKGAELVHSAVQYEMEKRKAALDVVRRNLYGVIAKFEKQIKRIMRVITTIELYLGIEEELHQIQEGAKAPQDTPISFRQMVLYIDEEVGAHEDGGLDFRSIKQFDKWLVTGNNIDIVLPEKKGVVVLNPRRHDKHYCDNGFLNVMLNVPNHQHTYILIRNGDNIYRIFTEKLIIKERLFPKKKELQELYDQMQKESWDDNKEKIEDQMHNYKKQAILLQGLIDRTDVFHPLPVENFSIFKMHEYKKAANFIYDGETALHDGRPMFWDWHKLINKTIAHGSRVLILNNAEKTGSYSGNRYMIDNGRIYYNTEHNYPDPPCMGVYEVEEYKGGESTVIVTKSKMEEYKKNNLFVKYVYETRGGDHKIIIKTLLKEPHLTIRYNPGDEVGTSGWTYDPRPRKNRVRYRILQSDKFVLNYDQLDISDLQYYLRSRANREDYLTMMPVLKTAIAMRKEEMKNEEFFIRFVTDRNESKIDALYSTIEKRVRESIRWWKYKNKWKRPITKDDTLALRMIEQRITSKKYDTFTHYNKD